MTENTPLSPEHPDSPEPSKGRSATAGKPEYRCVAPKLPDGASFQPSVAATDKVNDKGQRLYEVNTRINPLRRKMNELRRQGYTTKQIKEIERSERKTLERIAKAPRATCPSCGYEGPVLDGKCDSCQAEIPSVAA